MHIPERGIRGVHETINICLDVETFKWPNLRAANGVNGGSAMLTTSTEMELSGTHPALLVSRSALDRP